jgi:hypothetical protein
LEQLLTFVREAILVVGVFFGDGGGLQFPQALTEYAGRHRFAPTLEVVEAQGIAAQFP